MPGNEIIGEEELIEIKKIFDSGAVLFGHGFDQRRNGCYKVREFEEKLTAKFGSYAAVCSSGTAALFVALKVLDVQQGDYVAIQAYNFIASAEAVVACGAIPIVVNIDESLNMCPISLEQKFNEYQFKAVIATDMQGNPADYASIKKICMDRHARLIEDACQAIGGKYEGEFLGTVADVGVFSLDFGKTITTGEGGAIFTKSKTLSNVIKAYIDHGHANEVGVDRGNDNAVVCGFNFRMSEMQAAVGIAQLGKLDRIVDTYNDNHKFLFEIIDNQIRDHVVYRKINDIEYLHDGIIFFIKREIPDESVKIALSEIGISFKNVPSAIKWHSAEYWNHIWLNHPVYSKAESRDWQRSNELLKRAWSFSINVLDNQDDLRNRASKIVSMVQRFL
jgi:8-amino-3,8-dideoxy-alpha-D-manno-octulosonate transaminase